MSTNRAHRAAALLVLSLGLAPATLAAETPEAGRSYIFETVDSYGIMTTARFEVTGILQGESAPRTLSFFINNLSEAAPHTSRCDRLALLAMGKPGLYFLEVVQGISFGYTTCRLTRR